MTQMVPLFRPLDRPYQSSLWGNCIQMTYLFIDWKMPFFFFFTNEMPNMDTNMLFFIPVLQTSNFEWSMNMGLISPLPKPYASCTQFILQILTELKLNKLHFSSSGLLLLKYHLITEENGDSWCLNHITSYEFKCLTTNILSRFLVLNNFPCVFDSVN